MSTSADYYEILGVSREASQDDVRKAFRKLAITRRAGLGDALRQYDSATGAT
jgi:hypothetical protein